jgi:hypothetical protein
MSRRRRWPQARDAGHSIDRESHVGGRAAPTLLLSAVKAATARALTVGIARLERAVGNRAHTVADYARRIGGRFIRDQRVWCVG